MAFDVTANAPANFGTPRVIGRCFLSAPVCFDALGETWAGYITDGEDRGRMVLITVVSAGSRTGAIIDVVRAAELAVSIRHPHVLAVLEYSPSSNDLVVISEYLDGEPLDSLMALIADRGKPLNPAVGLRIMRDAIGTLGDLSHQHGRGLVQPGGLSPESVFVTSFGESMLRHPGISDAAMLDPIWRRHPAALPYRAPEQIAAPRQVDERADVFSAGVILWELLTGRPLFGEPNHRGFARSPGFRSLSPEAVEERIATAAIPDLRTLGSTAELDESVVQIVERALDRDPSLRFADLASLHKAIDALPPGSVASPVAVAAAVEQLAGARIANRQKQLADAAPMRLHSSAPPSGRASMFPEESHQITLAANQRLDQDRLDALMQVANGELPPPTSPRPMPLPPGRATAGEAPSVTNDRGEDLTIAPLEPLLQAPSAVPPPVELSPNAPPARGGWALAAAAVLALAGGGYALWNANHEANLDAASQDVASELADEPSVEASRDAREAAVKKDDEPEAQETEGVDETAADGSRIGAEETPPPGDLDAPAKTMSSVTPAPPPQKRIPKQATKPKPAVATPSKEAPTAQQPRETPPPPSTPEAGAFRPRGI